MTLYVAAILLLLLQAHPTIVAADCIYEGARYSEGSSVSTAEPCLRCACAQGALLCYLRVCPQLPDPPPPGCFILHKHKTCCSELICTDFLVGTNRVEARIEPDIPEIPYNQSMIGNGCIYNGTIYGSGSAMTTSSLCEYCYCISGRQKCVKPRCLLPIEGCTALYAPHSCCPTHYKCNNRKTTTSTSSAPINIEDTGGGCYVSGKWYADGGKILGVGHSPCDNCYCIRRVVRCMPLSCAPPLLGCTPVVPPGECCAASYNCSGVIEVQPKLNYGHYPVVSKEYAKLRKEVQRKTQELPHVYSNSHTPLETKNPHYIIAQSSYNTPKNINQKPSTPYYFTTPQPATSTATLTATVRLFPETTRHLPLTIESLSPDSNQYSRISLTTTKVNNNQDQSNIMRPVFKPSKFTKTTLTTESPVFLAPVYKHLNSPEKNSNDYLSPLTTPDDGLTYSSSIFKRKFELSTPKVLKYSNYVDIDFGDDIFADGRNNRGIDDQAKDKSNIELSRNITSTTEASTTQEITELTTSTEITTTTFAEESTTEITTQTETFTEETSTEELQFAQNMTETSNDQYNSTLNIQNNTSASVEINETYSSVPPELSMENKVTVSENISKSEIIGNNTECIEELSNANYSESNVKERTDYFTNETDVTTNDITSVSETDITSTDNPTTLYSLFVSTKNDVNNISATSVPFEKISPEIEAILNITKTINKKDEDYEYDYNEPSLPPSLPNLKIIPFVAADAVVEDKVSATVAYPPDGLRGTDDPLYGYTLNLFSPPIETEGGFVPRDPPILNNFYENAYHTTGIVDITAGTAVPAITNPPKNNEDDCMVDGREVRHGELTSELGACSVCLCLFGDIVCQPPKCPPPPAGCRRTQKPEATPVCCGHIVCNGDEESPTVVLDRIDATSNSQDPSAEVLATPDPFRDVIRTEQAPDLQSLIGDIMPYLVRQTSTLKSTTHMTTSKSTQPVQIDSQYTSQNIPSTTELPVETKHEDEGNFSLDSVLQFFFPHEKEEVTEKQNQNDNNMKHDETISTHSVSASPFTTQGKYKTSPAPNLNSWYLSSKTQPDLSNRNSIDIPSSVGLLKLAGCNIYGRMYRVGKIISELSGPCLECMCTEIGVQCRSLTC